MSQWPLAAIFDFDGVIVHSEPLHYRAFQETLAAEGIMLTEAEYYRHLIGFDDVGCFRHLFEYRKMPLEKAFLERLLRDKQSKMAELMASGAFHALPGVEELVTRLSGNRIPLAICSGAIGSEIRTMLAGVKLEKHFSVIVAAEDVEVGKPDPRGYLMAAHRLSQQIGRTLLPEHCLVVEDAPTVIRTTRGVGFRVLGVASSYPLESLSHATWAARSLAEGDLLPVVTELRWLYDHS